MKHTSTPRIHRETRAPAACHPARRAAPAATETVDLSLRLLEHLVDSREPIGVSDLARAFGVSKTKAYRHVQTLVRHSLVRQDPTTRRYEAGIKLFMLGERLRERFDIVSAAREDMERLRDKTGHAVTLSTVVDDRIVILELFHGHSIVDFGTRPGTLLDMHASAHGKVALAFGPPALLERCLAGPLKAWTPHTLCTRGALERALAEVKKRGWATAANEAIVGVNGVVAPIFDRRGDYAGAIALAGSVQHIPATPSPAQIAALEAAASSISKKMGWNGR